MNKKEALKLFDNNQAALGRALGKARSTISVWPDELEGDYLNLLVGIAYRLGKEIPDEVLIKPDDKPE